MSGISRPQVTPEGLAAHSPLGSNPTVRDGVSGMGHCHIDIAKRALICLNDIVLSEDTLAEFKN